MTQEELSLLDESEREAWELERKATPGPWQEGWKNEHGAGCTGPRTAALCFASNDHLPIVIQPNAHKQSDNPEHWYGAAVARTAEKSDALFIAAARNLLEPLLSKVVRLTQERNDFEQRLIKRGEAVKAIEAEFEAAESRISDLTKEKDSALQERDILVQKYNAVYVRLEKEVKHPNTGMMPLSAELIDLAQWIVKRTEAAESERDRYKERAGVLEKFVAGIDPFCLTIHGDDECNWCGRERPRDIDKWQDAQREEHHNADCEFITILKGGN